MFCSRTGPETLAYLLKSTAVDKKDSTIIDFDFALAHYYMAYISIERGDLKNADDHLSAALALSPQNSVFLSEAGHLRQLRKQWDQSIELYEQAIGSADSFSPESSKVFEKGKALRGKAYSLVELDRLNDAYELYAECLKIDPNDKRAKAEMRYIDELRKKRSEVQE